jgi:hypothetical protein
VPEPARDGADLPRDLSRETAPGSPGAALLPVSDILLLIQRQNE